MVGDHLPGIHCCLMSKLFYISAYLLITVLSIIGAISLIDFLMIALIKPIQFTICNQ